MQDAPLDSRDSAVGLRLHYPLGMTNIADWKFTIFHGKAHVISMAIFHYYVKSLEGRLVRDHGINLLRSTLCFNCSEQARTTSGEERDIQYSMT